jgi:glycosyltransferase involved in cell wall biosynthesis
LIRVAFECCTFRKGKVGGYEGYLLDLFDGLHEVDPDDMEITIFVLSSQREHFEPYSPRFKIRTVSVPEVLGRILWQNLVLPFHSFFYDVVFSTANARPPWLFAKSITMVHDLQYHFFPEYWSRSMLLHRRLFVPMSIRRSDLVTTLSETVRDEILREFGREDVAVCYPPIAIDPLPDCGPVEGIPEPFFLVPSILSMHKNIENLALACREFEGEQALPFMLFIGAYPPEAFPHEIAPDRGRVLGYVDRGLRDQLMARCAAMILPSLYEGFGMPYAEALMVGRPVIACDIPIAHEVLGDAATFIQSPFGPAEIVVAIEKFLRDGERLPSREAVAKLEARTQRRNVAVHYLELIRGVADA